MYNNILVLSILIATFNQKCVCVTKILLRNEIFYSYCKIILFQCRIMRWILIKIEIRFLILIIHTVIATYCSTWNAPSSLYSTDPSKFNTTINSNTTYNCKNGYIGWLTITCNALNATAGSWSNFSGSCQSTMPLILTQTHSSILITYSCSQTSLLTVRTRRLPSQMAAATRQTRRL